MSADWERVQEIFDAAWALTGEARRAVIEEHCGADAALRAEVERMLRASDEERQATVRQTVTARNNRFGNWQTESLLGRGGMAEVYLAHRVDGHLEQRAALKVMSRYLATPGYIERFRRERQLLARLDHPNIARLLDGGVSADGEPYMVMEYVEGQRLDHYCDKNALAIRDRVQLMQSLCHAVESAHRNLILHRDIKASNVLVTAQGAVKLLDFGAARELDGSTLETHAPLTPAYASPEQLRGDPVTTLSDVYGLGATLYRLLAGVPPFGEGDQGSFTIFHKVLEEDPPAVSASAAISPAVRRELRGDLDNIVRKAMEKDPARRYAAAERLSDDLERWLEKRPIEARARTLRYRAERFLSRNLWGVLLGLALLMTLAAAAVAVGWQLHQVQATARRNARLTEFLTRVMGLRYDAESSPMRALGRSTHMIDVIRYAGQRLDSEMADQPQLEARLDADLGHALAELGYFPEAERSLQRGLELVDPHADPALAGELTGYLARNHFLEGMVRGTEKEFDEALRLIRSKPSPGTRATEQLLLLNLAPVRELRGGLTPEVASMTERAVELGEEIGEASPAYALSLQARADLRFEQHRMAEAEADVRRAIAIQESMSVLPLEHAQSLAVLAAIRAGQGKLKEAEGLVEQASAAIEESLGRGSLNFQMLRVSQAQLTMLQGDFPGAARIFSEADDETSRELPMADWVRARALLGVGAALSKMRRTAEARSALERAWVLVQDDPGADSPLGQAVEAMRQKLAGR